ncbi:hypothetical protein HGM15179_006070 [Zosterops borbonicus]|uniref:Uncharacterized protein n=1 Tax=Zosterops borbonicus TaxID=364589 RepID=A0A8K1LPI1_9PASS|nr:hypothetical protein HGM15179_006069 [Zosterops borbonicus]TRZ21049.1 hypothetical protein HGM15179_006070 [Zosterops borbonicus]
MIPGSAAGPGSPGRRWEVPALLGRDPLSPQVQRHHPDQSLRLLSVYLRVFHGPKAGGSMAAADTGLEQLLEFNRCQNLSQGRGMPV